MNATYETKDGCVVEAVSGDVVYTPKGAEYKVRFHSFQSERAGTVGINFLLWNESSEECSLAADVKRFIAPPNASLIFAESEYISYSTSFVPNRQNAILYKLLSDLGQEAEAKKQSANFRIVEKGLTFLNEHPNSNIGTEEVAKVCHISAVYFRKLFKRYTGKTFVEYKISLRLKNAERYLKYGEQSIGEIAELSGYSDPAYFIKQFKKEYGVSPLVYRTSIKK